MVSKVRLLYRTVRHLKGIQVFYQLYYRLKRVGNLTQFDEKVEVPHNKLPIKFALHLPMVGKVTDNTFTFLNLTKAFDKSIDWNFQEYGKLWNYNLQYFDYLHQSDLSEKQKEDQLLDIGNWLRDGRLSLEPYPVSLRIMNGIRYCSRLKVNNRQILKDLYAQLNYLSQHLEYHILGNHLLENAFALMMGGYAFSEPRWISKAKSILKVQLNEQILKDGAHFELSPMYHQIILYRMLELSDWYGQSEGTDSSFLSFIREKTSAMLSWLKAMTFTNGDIPHFNDSADGITFTSAVLFDYAKKLGYDQIANVKLSDSGYRKFSNSNYELVVDAGKVGPEYQPGHAHADALSFVLYYNEKPVVVDTGTSTYQIGSRRAIERSTPAHNTVVIENTNQSEVWGGFRVGQRANVKINLESKDELKTSHDGYLKNYNVIHARDFSFSENRFSIKDHVDRHKGTALIHFHPTCNIDIEDTDRIIVNENLHIVFDGAETLKLENYEYVVGYNKYLAGKVALIEFVDELNTHFEFKS
ncbi:MAG: alginate lyase family protein [Pedobacter sp.]|nr:MAG: alginate lyase family protein [Pedobacter sp.]